MPVRLAIAGWALGLVMALAGCGSSARSSTGHAATAPATTRVHRVVMRQLAFTPGVVHARVGQQIIWTNDDNVPHNVTPVGQPPVRPSPRTMAPGATYSVTLTRTGTFHYFCSIHPWMHGTVVVSR